MLQITSEIDLSSSKAFSIITDGSGVRKTDLEKELILVCAV